METNTFKNDMNYYDQKAAKRRTNILFGVIALLTVIITVLAVLYFTKSKKLDVTSEEKQLIEEERTNLEGQLNGMILEYDSLKTENDSVNNLLSAEQQRIKRLLSVQASDAQKIKMYKNELETLRKVMRSYIVQIDSLNTRNMELTQENVQVRTQLRDIEQVRDELAQEKENLSSQVSLASVLNAKNVTAEGINKSNKPKDRVGKVEKIKVCFTIRENAIAKAGTKTIYLRIVRPDNIVLTTGETDLIEVDGQQLVYTAQRELEYENKDIDMCIFWDKTEELIAGTYNIFLYSEGAQIGTSTFDLK